MSVAFKVNKIRTYQKDPLGLETKLIDKVEEKLCTYDNDLKLVRVNMVLALLRINYSRIDKLRDKYSAIYEKLESLSESLDKCTSLSALCTLIKIQDMQAKILQTIE